MSAAARRTAAMDRSAEHGIRWHERLTADPRRTRSRSWKWVLLLALTAAAALIILHGYG